MFSVEQLEDMMRKGIKVGEDRMKEKSIAEFMRFLNSRLSCDCETSKEIIRREFKYWVDDFRSLLSQ